MYDSIIESSMVHHINIFIEFGWSNLSRYWNELQKVLREWGVLGDNMYLKFNCLYFHGSGSNSHVSKVEAKFKLFWTIDNDAKRRVRK